MKIKFNSDDDLPLTKQLKFMSLTIMLENCKNYKMLQYERIDVSEGIDLNKSDKSK